MTRGRLVFSKTGKAIYISHLDLMRTFQRAFTRAGLKVWHTEGFNPHTYISIAQPLPVGMSGLREMLDFEAERLPDKNELIDKLNEALPEGLCAIACGEAETKFKQIEWAVYELMLEYEDGPAELTDKLSAVFRQKELIVNKKTKRGYKDVDIRPNIKSICFETTDDGHIVCRCTLAAGAVVLNPVNIIKALAKAGPDKQPAHVSYRRTDFLTVQGEVFQ